MPLTYTLSLRTAASPSNAWNVPSINRMTPAKTLIPTAQTPLVVSVSDSREVVDISGPLPVHECAFRWHHGKKPDDAGRSPGSGETAVLRARRAVDAVLGELVEELARGSIVRLVVKQPGLGVACQHVEYRRGVGAT